MRLDPAAADVLDHFRDDLMATDKALTPPTPTLATCVLSPCSLCLSGAAVVLLGSLLRQSSPRRHGVHGEEAEDRLRVHRVSMVQRVR